MFFFLSDPLSLPFLRTPQALLHTRNVSAEEAAIYYFNKLENEVPIS